MVTLCEHTLCGCSARTEALGERSTGAARDPRPCGEAAALQARATSAGQGARPSPARPPTQVALRRVRCQPGLARARARRDAARAGLSPQRNPSAAGRALVLITPHPLAAGVTSATRALSSSFQNRRLPKPSHSQMPGSAATGPAPSRRRS